MLCSILLHASPNEVRLVLVDPKRVELNHYEHLPHLLTPVVTNPRMAANVLANLIGEMESRYEVMGEARARNLIELNRARRKAGEAPLPYILCVIDELADLMMVAPAEVEDSIIRLAQKSRAVGIHLRAGDAAAVDRRDHGNDQGQHPGPDRLLGRLAGRLPRDPRPGRRRDAARPGGHAVPAGRHLEAPAPPGRLRDRGRDRPGSAHWARQGEPEFDEALLEVREETRRERDDELSPDHDDLLEDAARIVVQSQTASVSMIQRRLRVGYTRAGRLIDMLERRGIISGYEGSKPRQVLVSEAEVPRMLERLSGGGAACRTIDAERPDEPDTEAELEPLSARPEQGT